MAPSGADARKLFFNPVRMFTSNECARSVRVSYRPKVRIAASAHDTACKHGQRSNNRLFRVFHNPQCVWLRRPSTTLSARLVLLAVYAPWLALVLLPVSDADHLIQALDSDCVTEFTLSHSTDLSRHESAIRLCYCKYYI